MIKNKWQCVPAIILVLLLVSEVIWYSPYTNPRRSGFSILDVTQRSEGSETDLSITYQLYADLPLDATVVVTPLRKISQDLPIYVYYDSQYPTVGTDWIFSAMLEAHLKAELRLREYSGDVKTATAVELEKLMLANESAVIIMASSVFPSNIFSKERNLVKPWLDAGGILIWFGFYIGYYVGESGMKKEDMTVDMPQNLRENGSKQLGLDGFFEYLDMKDNPEAGIYSSPVSDALGITYNLILQAPLLDMVWAKEGLVLGKIGGNNTFRLRPSVSMNPVGKGGIILFGFFLMQSLTLNGPELAAWDIAQIMCSGVLQMDPNSALLYRNYSLSEEETKTDVFNLSPDSDVVGFVVFEYTSRDSDNILFHREFMKRK